MVAAAVSPHVMRCRCRSTPGRLAATSTFQNTMTAEITSESRDGAPVSSAAPAEHAARGGGFADRLRPKGWRHAVGEVLLVALGVLMALAVNNWNSDRQDRRLERDVLRQLRSSLNGDLTILEEVHTAATTRAHRIGALADALHSGGPPGDSADLAFGAVIRFWDIPLNRSVYEALKVRGLSLVSNDSLRLQIADVYDRVYVGLEHSQADDRSAVLDIVRPYYLRNFRGIRFGDSATPVNHAAVVADPYFRNVLEYRTASLQANTLAPTAAAARDVRALLKEIDAAIGGR